MSTMFTSPLANNILFITIECTQLKSHNMLFLYKERLATHVSQIKIVTNLVHLENTCVIMLLCLVQNVY